MSRPFDILDAYADRLEAASGDAAPVRAARSLLGALGVVSGRGVLGRLARVREMPPFDAAVADGPDAQLSDMAEHLEGLASFLHLLGKEQRWLLAYIDILRVSGATYAQLRHRFQQTKRAGNPRHSRSASSMSLEQQVDIAEKLSAELALESRQTEGSERAILALDSSDVTKSVALAIARNLTGADHRSKKAALDDIRSWYWHRRGARKSAAKIAQSARTL